MISQPDGVQIFDVIAINCNSSLKKMREFDETSRDIECFSLNRGNVHFQKNLKILTQHLLKGQNEISGLNEKIRAT